MGHTNRNKGTTAECLKHFYEALLAANTEEATTKLENAATHLKTSVKRFLSLMEQNKLPTGVCLIRLRHFLTKIGYEVIEWLVLPNQLKELATCIVEGKITMREAATIAGYKREDSLMGVLLGRENTSPERLRQITSGLGPASPPPIGEASAPQGSVNVIDSLAALITAMLPLAAFVASDSCSEENRRALRKKTGDTGVFNLANALHKLCSETALRQAAKKGGEHHG